MTDAPATKWRGDRVTVEFLNDAFDVWVIPNVVSVSAPTHDRPCFHIVTSKGSNHWIPAAVVARLTSRPPRIIPKGTDS